MIAPAFWYRITPTTKKQVTRMLFKMQSLALYQISLKSSRTKAYSITTQSKITAKEEYNVVKTSI